MVKFDIVCPECKGSGKVKVNLTLKITEKPKAVRQNVLKTAEDIIEKNKKALKKMAGAKK